MKRGDCVVVRGRTIGTISNITASCVTVSPVDMRHDESGGFEIRADQAAQALRPLATTDEAHAAIASLSRCGPADTRDVGARSMAYRRAFKSGDLAEQIRELGSIYHRDEHDHAERQSIDVLERSVYGELAIVLGKPRRSLKAEIRAAVLGEKPPASLALPDHKAELAAQALPDVAGYTTIGAFAIDTKMAIGELVAELTLAVQPGIWLSYVFGDIDDEGHHLIAVHRDHISGVEQLARSAKPRGEVTAEAASVALCDIAELEDQEFITDVQSAGTGLHGQRCLQWLVGGDGTFSVSVASNELSVVYVRVDFE